MNTVEQTETVWVVEFFTSMPLSVLDYRIFANQEDAEYFVKCKDTLERLNQFPELKIRIIQDEIITGYKEE